VTEIFPLGEKSDLNLSCNVPLWNNKVYQFLAVPFGLAVAPQVFTRLVQTVIVHLHTHSVQANSYLKEFDSEILSRVAENKNFLAK
jgi:hypothetical protein